MRSVESSIKYINHKTFNAFELCTIRLSYTEKIEGKPRAFHIPHLVCRGSWKPPNTKPHAKDLQHILGDKQL
jgi:hypothetical protein